MRISAVLIVKNEEVMLPKCLESIQDFDEIVILDTGSKDSTPDIMRQWAAALGPMVQARIGEYTWRDNFAEARNEAQKTATGDWIFVIDADETLGSKVEDIKEYVQRLDPAKRVVGFWIESVSGTSRHTSPRLYRRSPDIFWKASVHNYLTIPEEVQSDFLIHAGYSPAHKDDPDRALRMLEKATMEEPESARYWYYLGREYGYKHRWAASEKALRKCLQYSRWSMERADAHLLLARALWFQRKGPDARMECLKAIGMNPEFKEALLFMGDMSYPAAKEAWHRYAQSATQKGLLFARVK